MFQFPGLPPHRLCVQRRVSRYHPGGVAPFGHPRITACWQLLAAFRSHPRPSSALGAKASTVRPCSLGIPIAWSRPLPSRQDLARFSASTVRQRVPSIAIDSSSLLCTCPGTSQAHRLSSGAPTLRSVQPTTTGQPRRPDRSDKNAARSGPARSNRRGPSPFDGRAFSFLFYWNRPGLSGIPDALDWFGGLSPPGASPASPTITASPSGLFLFFARAFGAR